MPLQVMTNPEIEAAIELMDPVLRHQMLTEGVSKHCAAVLAEAGFTSSRTFRCFASSMDHLALRVKVMGLEPEKDLVSMAQTAKLQVVWANCHAYEVAEEQDRAEKKVLGIPRASKPRDYTVIRQQYEKKVCPNGPKKKKRELPGNTILDRMDHEIENGEFKAPRLTEIPSLEEVEDAEEERTDAHGITAFPVVTAKGVVRMSQSIKVKIPPISDPEEFRTRMDLLATAVEFEKIKHASCTIIATADRDMWSDHKDYILGDEVRLKEEKDDGAVIVARPKWSIVMHYEYAIRERAAELMTEGSRHNGQKPMDIKSAFKEARLCEKTHREHFLNRLHLQQVAGLMGAESLASGSGQPPRKKLKTKEEKVAAHGNKGSGKGKGKGKKGKRDLPPGVKLAAKREGKPICFKYGESKCKDENCKFLHVCQICLKDGHPWQKCKSIQ